MWYQAGAQGEMCTCCVLGVFAALNTAPPAQRVVVTFVPELHGRLVSPTSPELQCIMRLIVTACEASWKSRNAKSSHLLVAGEK